MRAILYELIHKPDNMLKELKKGKNKKEKVFVGMSGGVDSSVAAFLLKNRGYEVIGIFMKCFNLDGCAERDAEDARRVAEKLNIPFYVWDFEEEYKKKVVEYMVAGYRQGITPNPDVMCNKEIKFGLFLKKALEMGANYVATGHYVRLVSSANNELNTNKRIKNKFVNSQQIRYSLMVARDAQKDQSYFLWTLTQKQLKHCLFPIGDYVKPEVRKMAKKFSLPTANKKDSQGVCFIGPLDMKNFLQKYIKPKNGMIYHTNGKMLGTHDGVSYYTIGQRHGLDIKNGKGPYYVVDKDVKSNVLYVGSKDDLLSQKLKLTGINWINRSPVDKRHDVSLLDARIRYRAELSKAIVKDNGEVIFKKKETAITSGQSAVFYRGEELLGGGIIE